MSVPDADSAAGKRLSVGRWVLLGLVIVAVGGVAWWAAPRSADYPVDGSVCVYNPKTFDRVALVNCGGPVIAVQNHSQGLVPHTDAADRAAGGPVATIPSADVNGRLHVSKAFFGGYRYEFVAANGTVTPLEQTDVYSGGVTESLR